jgi:hypothetical protein
MEERRRKPDSQRRRTHESSVFVDGLDAAETEAKSYSQAILIRPGA